MKGPRDKVVAWRHLELQKPDGARSEVEIAICVPRKTGPIEWACAFKITGLEGPMHGREAHRMTPLENGWGESYGVDSVQALFLALVGSRRYVHLLTAPGTSILWNDNTMFAAGRTR